jgi:pimeloyl-ACP methyl ester carboxylesterase
MTMGELIKAGDVELWVEQRGEGPDVLLIAGLGDVAEAWEAQLDALAEDHRVTAYDNRCVGRSSMADGPYSTATMADDAAALLAALEIDSADVVGFSMGSGIAQELALRHPEVVRSLVLNSTYARTDAYMRSVFRFFRTWPAVAPSERAFFEGFFLWVYTARAHADGTVDQIVGEAMAFPHQQPVDAFQRAVDACLGHDAHDRLHEIAVPTLAISGGVDIVTPPRYGQAVADRIPGAEFVVMPTEAHQPFQEVPDAFNAQLREFWRRVHAYA